MSLGRRLVLMTIAVGFVPVVALSQDCAPQDPVWPGTQYANFITFVSPTPHSWITAGFAMWNSECDVDQIPYFDTSGSPVGGTFNVNVVFNPNPNPNS